MCSKKSLNFGFFFIYWMTRALCTKWSDSRNQFFRLFVSYEFLLNRKIFDSTCFTLIKNNKKWKWKFQLWYLILFMKTKRKWSCLIEHKIQQIKLNRIVQKIMWWRWRCLLTAWNGFQRILIFDMWLSSTQLNITFVCFVEAYFLSRQRLT